MHGGCCEGMCTNCLPPSLVFVVKMIGEAEYEEIQETQLSTLIEVKENDACQQHIVRASIREPPNTDVVVVYEETHTHLYSCSRMH